MNRKVLAALALVLMVSACANPPADPLPAQDPSGFFSGVWHGMIVTFSFIGSLFSDNIVIYDIDNTGGWYDFGFLLGAGIFFGSGGSRT